MGVKNTHLKQNAYHKPTKILSPRAFYQPRAASASHALSTTTTRRGGRRHTRRPLLFSATLTQSQDRRRQKNVCGCERCRVWQQQQQQQQQNTAGHEVSVVPFVLTPTLMNDSGAALTCFVLLRSLQQQQRHASSPDNLRRYRMETPSVLRRSSQLNTTSSSTSHSLSWNGSRCHTDSRTKLSGAGASEELVENEPPPAQACGESGAMANQVRHAVPAAAMMITMLIIITTTCTIQVFWKDTHPDEDGTDTSSGHAMDEE